MILPGFVSSLQKPLAKLTGWKVRVGPICIAELPLFLGDDWEVPSTSILDKFKNYGIDKF